MGYFLINLGRIDFIQNLNFFLYSSVILNKLWLFQGTNNLMLFLTKIFNKHILSEQIRRLRFSSFWYFQKKGKKCLWLQFVRLLEFCHSQIYIEFRNYYKLLMFIILLSSRKIVRANFLSIFLSFFFFRNAQKEHWYYTLRSMDVIFVYVCKF